MVNRPIAGGGGKEELRASFLKSYLLRLREEKGERVVRSLLSEAGVGASALENETLWISVSAARKILSLLENAFGGPEAIASRGEWMVHNENLGTYVRLLRAASQPSDAYRLLAENAQEMTRVGVFKVENIDATSVRVTYKPSDADETPQDDERLSIARAAELAGLPRLWGLDEAQVVREKCLCKGDPEDVYLVRWKPLSTQALTPLAAVGAAVVTGAPVVAFAPWWVGLIVGGVGAGLGGAIGYLVERSAREKAARTLERHRIHALERGLELKGELSAPAVAPGELDGTVLGGKYRILRRIGSGGIGVVYSAEHIGLGSTVAIKVLRGAAARDASEIARLRREAQVQVTIEHPNVIRTLDLDQMPDGSLYVVMELLRGRTLADKLSREGPVPSGFAIPVFVQVCRALSAAHAKGVVHRDLKPGNIFLCDDQTVKVLDFGMSKLQSAESLTQEGFTLGTPEYMAPEQCIGAAVEPRTDLYALGVLMYEALTSELPIQSSNRRELLDLHQRQIPQNMRQRRPDLGIPVGLDVAVMTCLRKRIAERPRSAAELAEMLESIPLDGLPLVHEMYSSRRTLPPSDHNPETEG
ncbi:MAG: serine/threonine-protein kinase [Polyangiaceae bacterium]